MHCALGETVVLNRLYNVDKEWKLNFHEFVRLI
jgi:hypothetical protein